MNENKNLKFRPLQHSDKCYCNKHDYKKNGKPIDNKFIKCKSEIDDLKSKCSKASSSLESMGIRNFNVNSTQYQQQLPPKHLDCNKITLHSKNIISRNVTKNLTAQRENYERIKKMLGNKICSYSDLRNEQQQQQLNVDTLDTNRYEEIINFRLNNTEECFSPFTKFTIAEKLKRYNKCKVTNDDHNICEFHYKLNNRILPEPADINKNGEMICAKCNKTYNDALQSSSTTQAYKIILNIQSDNINSNKCNSDCSKNVNRKKSNKPCQFPVPDKSLALLYQEKSRLKSFI